MTDDHLLLTIGLDGAAWDVLNPLIERGDLPFIESIVREGVHGTNRSVLPHNTTPAWQAFARGADPSGLGVYNFLPTRFDGETFTMGQPVDATDYGGTPFWRALGEHGREAAVLNLHDTAPVDDTPGVMVAEHALPDETHVRPESVQQFVTPEPAIDPDASDAEYLDTLLSIIRSRFDLAEDIIRAGYLPDWLHLSIFYIDAIQHRFWCEPELVRAWREIDTRGRVLSDLLTRVFDDVSVSILSDHGHTRQRDRFYINNWLERQGYLTRRHTSTPGERLARVGLHRDRLEWWADALGLTDWARRLVPERTRRAIPDADGQAGPTSLPAKIDATRTLAVSPGADQVYFAPGVYPYGLVQRLRDLRHPDHGRPVFNRVVRAHQEYGPDVDGDPSAPDLLLEPNGYEVYYTMPASGAVWDSQLAEPRARWRSVHTRRGIFAASGPHVRVGERVDCRLVDVAPTWLHALGVPVPERADGDVLDIFEPGSEPAERAVERQRYGEAAGRDGDVSGKAERLRALGYLE